MNDLERCIAEQAECAAYLRGDGPDKAGARMGHDDWLLEQCLIMIEEKAN
jgi:hypothetical protein